MNAKHIKWLKKHNLYKKVYENTEREYKQDFALNKESLGGTQFSKLVEERIKRNFPFGMFVFSNTEEGAVFWWSICDKLEQL